MARRYRIVPMRTACPHDCPSTCALEVLTDDDGRVSRLKGRRDNAYTAGVICAKVARYSERLYHPERLLTPLARTGPKGSGQFAAIGWDEALDRIAEAFDKAESVHGSEAVWPYYFAGTMGLVQRDGIHRLRHEKRYSGQFDTICTNMAWTGYIAGTGRLAGPDPREMAKSDCIVIWGTNAAATQINVLSHAVAARKARGAKIVVVDVYRTETMRQADLGLCLRPGTDGALACAVMHILFRDGHADRDYLARYADVPDELEAHLRSRTPEWAAAITGLPVEEIEAFARLIGTTKKTFLRLGYGFTRQRNGVVAMHAATSIAVVSGAFQHEGGGAFHNNGAIYPLNKLMIEGADRRDPKVRMLDQSRIGAILTGDRQALRGGPPVTAMLIQNTNPMVVAPEHRKVKAGFAREDLFVAVHEQVMTDTARMADIVLPATMFLEHEDIYKGGGHQYLLHGPRVVEPPQGPRENHAVITALAERLGCTHKGNRMTPAEHIDWMLKNSGFGGIEQLKATGEIDCQPDFETAHYLSGFAFPDGRFRFKPDWSRVKAPNDGPMGPWQSMPALPDHWEVREATEEAHPFRLVTPPAHHFLNTSFNETPTSRQRETGPCVRLHPEDATRLGIADGLRVKLFNRRGSVVVRAKLFDGAKPGTLIVEGLWSNGDFEGGEGINTLIGDDAVAPYGGAAFHDAAVGVEVISS